MTNAIREYLSAAGDNLNAGALSYIAALSEVASVVPGVAASIVQELADQRTNLKLIASENYSSLASQLAMGNLLTDKYSEGYPYHRFYAGCDNVDSIESYAAEAACKLFGAEHAYVQPHSGADANLIAYWAILSTKVEMPHLESLGETNPSNLSDAQWAELRAKLGSQRLLGLDYYSGGHLTHGYRHNVSAQMFDSRTYSVNPETMLLDYDAIERQASEFKPLILLAGYSAYPRAVNFRRMREIADKVGAVLMVDMAHFAGLVAGGVFTGDSSPFPFAQVVTTTTHKTLRGPRGGMILCTTEFADAVDKGCPMVIGGPLPHVMAAKAVALVEASTSEFRDYSAKIVENSRALSAACKAKGLTVTTGGTDNHLFLVDVRNLDLSGRQAESALRECGITLNRNSLPFDPNGPWYTSGLRVGTPAVTTLGMGVEEMSEIAEIIALVLQNTKPSETKGKDGVAKKSKAKYVIDPKAKEQATGRVHKLLSRFLVYPALDLDLLMRQFVQKT
ncbi:MAG TPA: glycine hydroxymethyltransferase [Spirochaetia bacterium]|nr:glycine hydroxymethyltransferase [Spirochaetia bacterium]